jgi:hypothetical protein
LHHIAQFAETITGGIQEPAFQDCFGTPQLDKPECPSTFTRVCLQGREERVADGALRSEREDQPRETICEHGVDSLKPQPLTHSDERRATKGKERPHKVDHGMVVQKPKSRLFGEPQADRQLPDAGAPEEQDYLWLCSWVHVEST